MTLGKDHSISKSTFNKYVAKSKSVKINKVELIFVVPNKATFQLDREQYDNVTNDPDISVVVAVMELTPHALQNLI